MKKVLLGHGMPIHAEIRGPGDAVGALQQLFRRTPNLYFHPPHIAEDLIALRSIYRDDEAYTGVLVAFWKEIRRALRDPKRYGGKNGELRNSLAGVRRNKFPPEDGRDAVLRLLVRPYRDGIQVIAMRHRRDPPGMYGLAARRFTELRRDQ